jgi:hypothetical protein
LKHTPTNTLYRFSGTAAARHAILEIPLELGSLSLRFSLLQFLTGISKLFQNVIPLPRCGGILVETVVVTLGRCRGRVSQRCARLVIMFSSWHCQGCLGQSRWERFTRRFEGSTQSQLLKQLLQRPSLAALLLLLVLPLLLLGGFWLWRQWLWVMLVILPSNGQTMRDIPAVAECPVVFSHLNRRKRDAQISRGRQMLSRGEQGRPPSRLRVQVWRRRTRLVVVVSVLVVTVAAAAAAAEIRGNCAIGEALLGPDIVVVKVLLLLDANHDCL